MALPIWWQLPFQNVGGISINLVAFALISAINWWQLSGDICLSANKRRTHVSQSKPLHFRLCLASPGGFEPLTPRLGGECSIQLSYEDMSDFWLEIRIYATFSSFRIGSRLFNYLCFLDELLHPTFLDTFAFGGKLYNTYFDRFELSSSFSYSSKASGKPLP